MQKSPVQKLIILVRVAFLYATPQPLALNGTIVFHTNETNAFWTSSLFFDANARSERVR